MLSIPDSSFSELESAAHEGAFGHNRRPTPTDGQCAAGNYKMGRARAFGLPVVIEQPRGTYRNGVDPSGKSWTSRMAAHYGYIGGTKGADGDGVDCFIGPYLNTETAYVINQHLGGAFDEHKVMLGMPDEETARRAYNDSYDRGWTGLHSIVPTTRKQLQWWLRYGDMSRPIDAKNLPYEGLEAMTQKIYWNGDAQPLDTTLDKVLYQVRCSDSGENLLFDAVTVAEIIEDSDGVLAFDALVTPFARLERKMEVLRGVMERQGIAVKPAAMQITEPFKAQGRAMVAAIFELSDGQTVSIYFHNPDVTPAKMAPADELISWKWLLNKKDITVVVAPERGEDLNVREVARRIMALAEKNSPAFQRANAKRAETMGRIEGLKGEITSLEGELAAAQHELEVAKVAAEDRKAAPAVPVEDPNKPITSADEFHDALKAAVAEVPPAPVASGSDFSPDDYVTRIIEVHGVKDKNKLQAIQASMEKDGWVGRPVLAYKDASGVVFALTASHRIAAATNVGIEIPVFYVEPGTTEFEDESGNFLSDVVGSGDDRVLDFLKKAGDEQAAALMQEEIRAEWEVPPVPVETGEVLPDPAVVDPAPAEPEPAPVVEPAAPEVITIPPEERTPEVMIPPTESLPDTMSPVFIAEATADARRQLDDEITYARQGTFSPDYLAENRDAALNVYLEAHPEDMQAHEAALAVAWAARPVENEEPPAVAEPLPDPVEPTPPPEAAATPLAAAEPAEKIVDRALFQSVIDGTAPDMLAPELADQLEAAYVRHEADPELMALFERAVDAYQAAMMAATANL